MSSYLPPPRAGHCGFLDIDEDSLDTSDLHARIISPSTRQRLLAGHAPPHADFTFDAHTLLSELGRLAPSVAKDFVPKPSAEQNLTLRLINDIDFEGEEESYIAMSYVWKKVNRDAPRKVISPVGDLPFGWVKTVEQFPLPTSRATFLGVLNERRQGEGVFFDQVCINQEDDAEKAIAIGAMDTIYKNARMVVVALDDIAATDDELFFLQQYVQQYAYSELPLNQHPNRGLDPPFMQQHTLFWSFLERVLNSIWFERAWCAHEMRMGRNHVFLVPCVADEEEEESYTLIRFTRTFFLHMLVLASELSTLTSSQQTHIRTLLGQFERNAIKEHRDTLAVRSPTTTLPPAPAPASLIPTIAEIFQMKAGGNPRLPEYLRRLDANRDKTSITLNISRLPIVLKPTSPLQRPAMEDECLRQLLLVGLAARDPAALCTTGSPLQLHDGSVSWLCRPTQLDVPFAQQHPLPRFSKSSTISQASDGRAEYVQLDLVFLDLPHRTHPNPRFSAHVHRARELVDLCIQYRVQSHTLWNMWQATPNHPRGPAMRNVYIQTLACVFECGPRWLLDIAAQLALHSPLTVLDQPTISTLFNPQLHLQTYMHHPSALPSLSSLLTTISTLIAYGMPWASGATERTHGPLIITTPPAPAPIHPHAFPLAQPPLGKALIFAPFAHSKTLLVAVPDAVAGEAYAGLARGWILTPSNPYTGSPRGMVSWELRGKGVVFGERGFVEGVGGGMMVPRNHRVYGPGVVG